MFIGVIKRLTLDVLRYLKGFQAFEDYFEIPLLSVWYLAHGEGNVFSLVILAINTSFLSDTTGLIDAVEIPRLGNNAVESMVKMV